MTHSHDGTVAGADGERHPHRIGPLESEVGAEVYHDLLVAFLGQLSVQLAALHNAAASGDLASARYVAHQINGSAPDFGAAHLDELAGRLLRIGRDQCELLGPLVTEIDAEVLQLQAAGAGSAI